VTWDESTNLEEASSILLKWHRKNVLIILSKGVLEWKLFTVKNEN